MRKLAFSAVFLLASLARAADPCAPDVTQFCSDVKPGGGRVEQCLSDHKEKVSVACQGKLEANMRTAKAYMAEFSDACDGDVKRLCPGVAPGGGRLLKCLQRNDYAVGPRCQAELTKYEDARQKVVTLMNLCKADAEKLCSSSLGNAGELLACLKENKEELSPGCKSADPSVASEAATLFDTVEQITSQARVKETIQVLQALNSVAFSRNQMSFSFDYIAKPGAQPANLEEFTFNPLLVFGEHNEFAVQLKVPVGAIFPNEDGIKAGLQAQAGVADINTAFGWAFYSHGSIQQFLALALQWNSASAQIVGAPWVISPVYSISMGLAGWVSLTLELNWNKSFGNLAGKSGVNLLVLRPILVFNLPSAIFLALDTKLGWDFLSETFVPIMRFQVGKVIGRERNVSLGAWYQLSLNTVGQKDSFDFGIGASLSYFFDW